MNKFTKGVSYYTTLTLTDEVNFPENDVCCGWCKYLDKIIKLDRYYCKGTGETVYNVNLLSESCPLKAKENR